MSFLFGGKQKTPDELMKVRHAPYHASRPLPLHPDNKLDMHNRNPKHSETGVQAQCRPLRSRNRERACQSSETGALCVHMYKHSYTRAAYNSMHLPTTLHLHACDTVLHLPATCHGIFSRILRTFFFVLPYAHIFVCLRARMHMHRVQTTFDEESQNF